MASKIDPDKCIACTSCTVFCPVAKATPDFLGPRMMGPAQERFRLMVDAKDDTLHYCSNCKNCDISCPSSVPISSLIIKARSAQAQTSKPAVRDWILAHGATVGKLTAFIPAFLKNFGMKNFIVRWFLGLIGIASKSTLPPFASKTFFTQFAKHEKANPTPNNTKKVAFFPGCYCNLYDPQSGMEIIALLEKAGYTVETSYSFNCCGLPMIANGFWEDARNSAANNITQLKQFQEQNIPVLTGCPSCTLMFSQDYMEFFPELVEGNKKPVLEDACAFILHCVEDGSLTIPTSVTPAEQEKVVYHAPCHLRALGQGLTGLKILQHLPAVQAINANAGCCGISGSYGFKDDKYAIGMRVGSELFRNMKSSGAKVAASECGTCRVQMTHGTKIPSKHPLHWLYEAVCDSKKK